VAGRRFHLTFPPDLVEEPVIHALGERFGLVTTITRAHVEEAGGWVILEVRGDESAVADAVAWLAERGVHVERIDGESRG
jgi:ABC-type methionine transport system ATPase subunit